MYGTVPRAKASVTPLIVYEAAPKRQAVFVIAFVLSISTYSGFAMSSEKWLEVRSPHFTVVSNAGEKQARRVAEQFEQIHGALSV